MAFREFSFSGFLLRFAAALILVFATYNPSSYSYFHWLTADIQEMLVTKLFVGVVLLIGWVLFIQATANSLGALGLILTLAFFGTFFWMLIDWGILPVDSKTTIITLVEFIFAGVLAIGMSWSHIRRRLSGQVETDEIEG